MIPWPCQRATDHEKDEDDARDNQMVSDEVVSRALDWRRHDEAEGEKRQDKTCDADRDGKTGADECDTEPDENSDNSDED